MRNSTSRARICAARAWSATSRGWASRCRARPRRRCARTWCGHGAALNVAALQCQFEPKLLLTRSNYNAILSDHKEELATSYDTLSKYFARVNKTKKEGQNALDQFGTKTYSSFATVSSQFNFCSTANDIGRQAIFSPRGTFGEIAHDRLRELRSSLTPWGDQFRLYAYPQAATLPRFEKACWSKDSFNEKKCGEPLVPVTYASR
ncbi:hypothetical protein AB5I41_02240 [Sphingomonas sp. MMS24-JH45]